MTISQFIYQKNQFFEEICKLTTILQNKLIVSGFRIASCHPGSRIKFIHSEKASKFENISNFISYQKQIWIFFQIFVAFSEYKNFTKDILRVISENLKNNNDTNSE